MKKEEMIKLKRKRLKKMSMVQLRKIKRAYVNKSKVYLNESELREPSIFELKLKEAIYLQDLACKITQDDPQKAIDIFKQAITLVPILSAPYCSLAVVISNEGDHEVALDYAQKAVLFAPANYIYLSTYWNIVNRAWKAIGDEAIASKKLAKYTDYFEQQFTEDRMELDLINEQDILIRSMPELEFVERLQKDGEMYFKPTDEFRSLPSDNPRRDINENKPFEHELLPFDKVVKISDEVLNLGHDSLPIQIDARGGSVEVKGLSIKIGGQESIYCFSSLSQSNYKYFMEHYEWDKLGKYALVINNIGEFRNRVHRALPLAGKAQFKEGLVSYIPPRFIGNIRAVYQPYIKSTEYQSEFEYRVSCSTSCKPESIYIGSLEDVSEIVPVSELKKYLQEIMQKRHGDKFA